MQNDKRDGFTYLMARIFLIKVSPFCAVAVALQVAGYPDKGRLRVLRVRLVYSDGSKAQSHRPLYIIRRNFNAAVPQTACLWFVYCVSAL